MQQKQTIAVSVHSQAAHVIILGCGRSGTSIFGEFFEHLAPYTYFSEPPFDQLRSLDYSRPVAVKVPKESPGFPPTPGLSVPLEELLATIPEPRVFFWQLRHPLDTICSLRVGISKNWGHHPRPSDWEQWLSRPLTEQCAHHWNYLNSVGYEQVAHLTQITRFENMLGDPLYFGLEIGKKINLDTDANLEAIKAWSTRVQNTNNEKFREARTSQAYSTNDHEVRVGRWRENLSREELELVLPIIRDTAGRFAYTLPE